VSQQTPTRELIAEIEALPELIPQKFAFVKVTEHDVAANWKISVESFLEATNIRSTHPDTLLSDPVRQRERDRAIRPEQSRDVPVPEHRAAA